jgi:hypothetical protein
MVETGFVRVEAIVALDRSIRAAQAEQAAQVAASYDERSTGWDTARATRGCR